MDQGALKLKIILITIIINFFVRSFRRTVDQGALKLKIIIIIIIIIIINFLYVLSGGLWIRELSNSK